MSYAFMRYRGRGGVKYLWLVWYLCTIWLGMVFALNSSGQTYMLMSEIYLACFHMKFIRTTKSLDPLFQFRRIGRQHVLVVNPCRSFLFPQQAGSSGIARWLARTSSFARRIYNCTFWKRRKWGHLSRHHSTLTRGAISKRGCKLEICGSYLFTNL